MDVKVTQIPITSDTFRRAAKQPIGPMNREDLPEWMKEMVRDGRKPLFSSRQWKVPEELLIRHKLYLIGSLRNPRIPLIGEELRSAGYEVFDDWFAAGPEADDAWRDYEKGRGHDLPAALDGRAAKHVFDFDHHHLLWADSVVLALPAGKSGHMEFGWALGQGKRGYVLLDADPERYDVMYRFATKVVRDVAELLEELKK